jgi:hypothetical protein
MDICKGTINDHCCWIDGKICAHFEVGTVPGLEIACGLRRKLGSWDAVHSSAEYIRDVRPTMERLGVDCGDWPPKGEKCAACGAYDTHD